jgi:hypothetical protein
MTALTREQVEAMLADQSQGLLVDKNRFLSVAAALLAAWDRSEGLEADRDSAVEVAWKRGATEWVRLNYPKHYARFTGETP